jgi:NADPH-dependent ferric siderophore reductase
LINRTYTPTDWDPDRGSTTLVATTHGSGPGAARIASLEPGDDVQLFGPRASIDLSRVGGAPLFVGDETSFGLALAWRTRIGRPAAYCFEVRDPGGAHSVLSALGLTDALVVRAEPAAAPLAAAVLAQADAAPLTHLVLTGRAESIRQVRNAIRERQNHSGELTVKAYWAENRAGLD